MNLIFLSSTLLLIQGGVYFAKAKAAHSIYFQVLGDLGFAGLIIFLSLLLLTYRKLVWVTNNTTDEWLIGLSRMLKVSLVAYCAGGAALSLPYFDLSFAIFALTHILCEIAKRSQVEEQRKNDMLKEAE